MQANNPLAHTCQDLKSMVIGFHIIEARSKDTGELCFYVKVKMNVEPKKPKVWFHSIRWIRTSVLRMQREYNKLDLKNYGSTSGPNTPDGSFPRRTSGAFRLEI